MTLLIAFPYIREQTINDSATVKNGEAVFTHSSPRSSAPGTDRGTPAAIGSAGPAAAVTELRTRSPARAHDPVRNSVAAGPADPIAVGVPQSVPGAEERGELCVNTASPFFTVAPSLIVCSLI